MAERSAFGYIVKWILIPAVIGATGYYFVGPRIGGAISRTSDVSESVSSSTSPATETTSAPVENRDYPAPDVSVQVDGSVRPAMAATPRRSHRTKPRKKPSEPTPAPPAKSGDESPKIDTAPPGAAGDGGSAGGPGPDTAGGTGTDG